MRKNHTAVMCKTLDKRIWNQPKNYQDDLLNEKIQYVFSYTTNFNCKDFDFETVQKLCAKFITNEFKIDFNGKDINVIEYDLEADGTYSFRFSTFLEVAAPNEIVYDIIYENGTFKLRKLDISGMSLDDINNIPKMSDNR